MERLFTNRSSTIGEPWAVAEGGIEFRIETVISDTGQDLSHLVDYAARRIDLLAIERWESVRLVLAAECSFDPADLVPEPSFPPLRMLATIRSGLACTRRPLQFDYDGRGHRLSFALQRSELRGVVEFSGHLVRTATFPGGGSHGLAATRGAIIASSDPWEIILDERPAGPGSYIDIQYAVFGKGEHAHREPDILFDIEFGEKPILYLNERLSPDLREVLDSAATHGRTAAMRDAMFATIGQGVWTAMALHALQEIGGDPEESRDTWEYGVLRHIAQQLRGDTDENLGDLCTSYPENTRRLMHYLTAAPQRLMGIDEIVGRLIRTIGGRG